MREILFKARRVDGGEWAEGFYTEATDWRTYDTESRIWINMPVSDYQVVWKILYANTQA